MKPKLVALALVLGAAVGWCVLLAEDDADPADDETAADVTPVDALPSISQKGLSPDVKRVVQAQNKMQQRLAKLETDLQFAKVKSARVSKKKGK